MTRNVNASSDVIQDIPKLPGRIAYLRKLDLLFVDMKAYCWRFIRIRPHNFANIRSDQAVMFAVENTICQRYQGVRQ
jgi:hypothetical protein